MKIVRTASRFFIALLALFVFTDAAFSQSDGARQIQSFLFTPTGYFASKPINVYLYKSSKSNLDSKVVVALHGVDGSGLRACENWVEIAENKSLIVIAPEFASGSLRNSEFQMAGMGDSDRTHWLFDVVDQVFTHVKKDMNLHTGSFILFGHSAGAQFAHRYALMSSSPKADTIVAANAGSYMSPAYRRSFLDIPFPWSLSEDYTPKSELPNLYSRNFYILLGEKDTDTSAHDFPKSAQALYFGTNRLERGTNFYKRAQESASESGNTLNWKLQIVPGVGHSSKAMAKAAAAVLFP